MQRRHHNHGSYKKNKNIQTDSKELQSEQRLGNLVWTRGGNTFAVKFKTEGKKKGIEPVLGAGGEMLTNERRQKAPFSLKF